MTVVYLLSIFKQHTHTHTHAHIVKEKISYQQFVRRRQHTYACMFCNESKIKHTDTFTSNLILTRAISFYKIWYTLHSHVCHFLRYATVCIFKSTKTRIQMALNTACVYHKYKWESIPCVYMYMCDMWDMRTCLIWYPTSCMSDRLALSEIVHSSIHSVKIYSWI